MFRQRFSAIFWSNRGIFLPKTEKSGIPEAFRWLFWPKKGICSLPLGTAGDRWGPLGTAGDRWGPLGIARVARDGSGLTTSKVTAGHVAAVHGHVSRIALLVVSPRLGWEAKRTDYLPRVHSLNGGWTLYLPYAVPAIFGSPHMIKNRPPMIKNDETTIRTAGGASQSR